MTAAQLDRLREMAQDPVRQPMSRGVQFPSLAQQHLVDEQEIQRLRVALGEAVGEIDRYRSAVPDLQNLLVWAELYFIQTDNDKNADLLDRLDAVYGFRS